MADIQMVRTEADYEAALARVAELMDAEPGSSEGGELDVLVDLVDRYERRHEPMGHPDPVAAIEFRMEQAGLGPRDLIPLIGSRATVSEVLSGRRAITMPMARALHEHLGIPADVLRTTRRRHSHAHREARPGSAASGTGVGRPAPADDPPAAATVPEPSAAGPGSPNGERW